MGYRVNKYFLGETTPNGFKTNFDKQIKSEDFYTYILKGGPGTGKSSLMKKIALKFSDVDDIDIYYCSGDPDSLDAVVLKNSKTAIVDGTSPHIFDAEYPGIFQSVINLGECWNKENLTIHKTEIKKIIDENASWHVRNKRYIKAISSLNSDVYSIAKNAVNFEKLEGFINRISKKHIPKTNSCNGKLYFKKLSALTKNGYVTMPVDFYDYIFALDDSYFAGSDYFLQEISDIAISRGYTVIVSECNLFSESIFEHILIPELKLAFLSSNYINKLDITDYIKINFMRFYDKIILMNKKNRLDFSKKAAIELKNESIASLINAKKTHDIIEKYYIDSMNFQEINIITDNIISEISQKYK